MRSKRRNHSPEFKVKVALAAIKGERTIAELSQQFGVHPNQIGTWKKRLLANAGSVFGGGGEKKAAREKYVKDLEAKVDQMTLENGFLSKALGR